MESYHYNVKNQLTHIHNGENTLRYLYDKRGNLLEEQGETRRKQYSFDTANRQVSIASSKEDGTIGKLLQFNRYDGEGLRYETEENGKIIRFLFDRGELAQENQEGEETSYVRGHSPIALNRGGKARNYFVQDEMGSTLFLLDQDHEIRKSYRYDAFGNILEEMGDIPNRLMYTGQMYDGAAVQYYLRARFYTPAIGRFLQEDTYRGDGLNLYAYCANNPVMYYDPSGYGLCPIGKMNPGATTEGESETGRIPRPGDDDFIGPLTASDNHFIRGDGIGPKKKGVLGAHNMNYFDSTLESTGFPLEDLKVGAPTPHPTIEGIYAQQYRVPAYDGRGNFIGYKNIPDPKTIYDPAIISNRQMLDWGLEAMQNGVITGRIIEGTASNGLQFRGYIKDGVVTNFFPILPP